MSRRPGTRTRLATVAVGSLLVASLVACGGGEEKKPASAATSKDAPATPSATPSPEPYLEVPDGVRLTRPGANLSLGSRATVAWVPRQEEVAVAKVKVTGIEVTKTSTTLAGFDLDAAQRASTPYLVHTTITNLGERTLSDRLLPLYLATSSQLLLEPAGLPPDFKACKPAKVPAGFVPGKKVTLCQVFLVPQDDTPVSVTFSLVDGVAPVTWQGKVTELGKAKKGKKGKKGKKKSKNKKRAVDG